MFYARFLEKDLLAAKSKNKVKLLLGPRQSGKTTLLKHCLEGKSNIENVNLQDRRLRVKYERDSAVFLQELAALDRGTIIVVDEIQKVPAIFDDIQFTFDEDQERFDFFLTGSSARQLKKQSANLLPGRTHLFHLTPVLLAEQRDSEILPLRLPEGVAFPRRHLEDHLIFGNLPGLYNETKDSWAATITAYTELYIENEIRKESLVNDMGAFLQFLRLAALESGQIINYSKLAGAVGIAVNTVKNYYQILEDTYIGLRIPAFSRSRKKITSSPRFLIFDTGIRNALAQLPLNNSLLSLDAGHLFEQSVLIELFYRCAYHGRDFRLSTWRTATGAEVDAVIETPDEVIPIEIKWTDSPQKKDIRHLETFLDLHRPLSARAYIICRVDKPRKLSETITALPWTCF
ncbi:MAG: ATP-binding protein [Treponemataceae bacterium]